MAGNAEWSKAGDPAEPMRIEAVTDDGQVLVRFESGTCQTITIPLEQVPRYRRMAALDRGPATGSAA